MRVPVYLVVSTPPRVSSPFASAVSLPDSGLKETPRTSVVMDPWLLRLSMKVGTLLVLATVPAVRPTGPKPMIPSTPEKPVAEDAAPIDWDLTLSPPNETVSVYSVPENEPLP